ncbi:response regulator transcription factor [Ilyomonas limi]|uniref:Response regulator transcription factor n=1 Tax=Ilyomonas limi TaxID=2575867 RepID=A0A4U3L4B7_9BACT|nr:response regulator transcription factor [Ilyomonas limi]TKK69935.1 response regulator transcription factor [Ilyomonas limi]
MLRILIADDHAIVRRGLKDILLDAFPTAAIAEVCDAEELVQKVIKEQYDIVITDLSMPGRSGLEALQQIKAYDAKLPVLVLSVYPEEQYGVRVLKAGAAGYLNKDMAPEELVTAINRVLSGKKYITPVVAEKLASAVDFHSEKLPHEHLSDREFEVFKMLAVGKSVSEIGDILHLGVTTVSTYRSRILAKMNVKANAELTQYAMEYKLI